MNEGAVEECALKFSSWRRSGRFAQRLPSSIDQSKDVTLALFLAAQGQKLKPRVSQIGVPRRSLLLLHTSRCLGLYY